MTTALRSLAGVRGLGRKCFYLGTHRLVPPEKTIERVRPWMPVMGITRIANITGLDTIGIPVVMVCRPNSRSIAVSQGKGLNLACAKASGLMESVEGYHAERITLPLKLARYEELRYTHNLADVEELPRASSSLFHPNLPLLWIEGRDLLQDDRVWVPFETVHLNYTLPQPPGMGCFISSSNGLASGNHLLEAISHAICEVVERDAVTLWSLKGEAEQQASRLDLDTVRDPACREVLEKFARAGVAVFAWEVTSDIGIPAVLCLIAERSRNPLRPLPAANGSGCHPVREIALLRALTEAAQSRLTYVAGSRDDIGRTDYEHSLSDDVLERLALATHPAAPLRDFGRVPTRPAETFLDDVLWELDCLRAASIQRVVLFNLTHPEFRLPVARVVIPGMEPAEADDYIPGRRAAALLEGRL